MDQEQMWRRQVAMSNEQGYLPEKPDPDDDDYPDAENPPWEQISGQYLMPRQPVPSGPRVWDWDPALENSIHGISVEDFTGTGKVAAVVPLKAGSSVWSAGVRAPRAGASSPSAGSIAAGAGGAELDGEDQPSVQLRAFRSGNIARATAIVTVALLLGKVLGLLRTTLFAATFGHSLTNLDAFTNAFTVPDTIFNIVSGGALASAFIPVFADYLIDKRDRKTAWHIASSALNLMMALLVILAILGIIFAPQFLDVTMHPAFVQPGCTGPGSHATCEGPILVHLTRIMLLQPIFMGGATIAMAILQARQSFVLPALGQLIYTGGMIAGILAAHFHPAFGISAAAWGVVVGAVLQFAVQVPGLVRAKMRYRPTLDIFHPGIHEIARMMGPRVVNAIMLFVSVYISRDLLQARGLGLSFGYVTAFTLIMMPEAIIAQSVSQAAFPTLAAYVAAGEWDRLRDTIVSTIRGITYLAVPASLGIIVLATPISAIIVGHGGFAAKNIPLVSQPLLYFAIGLTGLSLVEILTRSFYALHNTRTPVEVSIIQFLLSIGLSMMLVFPMGAGGVALGSALSWALEAVVLLILLRPRLGGLNLRGLGFFLVNVLAASVVCALAALLIYVVAAMALPLTAFDSTAMRTAKEVGQLIPAVIAGCAAFVLASRFLGIEEVALLNRITRRVLRRR